MSYLKSRKVESTRIQNEFDSRLHQGKATYWKPFKFGRKWYVMTFQYNLYEVVPNQELIENGR